jgi:ribonuclease Z
MLRVIFLGTGGSMPTEGRNLPAFAVEFGGWVLLFDNGEDIQRQMGRAGIGLNKRMCVFITHMHADHVLGLPGLLFRLSLLGRTRPLSIFGPEGLIEYVKMNQQTINLGTTFEATVYGIKSGPIFSAEDLSVDAFEVDHPGIAFGYTVAHQRPTGKFLPEKALELGVPRGPLWKALASGESVKLDDGRHVAPQEVTGPRPRAFKVVYSGDTRPCQTLRDAAEGADLMICEAMFTSDDAGIAHERGHMTAALAAEIALQANVRLLALTHYSPRYGDGSTILDEASAVFPRTILARDLMRIELGNTGDPVVVAYGEGTPTGRVKLP